MTHMEVINKLAFEMVKVTGEIDHVNTYRWFIRQALDIGINHFTKDSEEIIAMTRNGVEKGRFKSIREASRCLGIHSRLIRFVLRGQHHTAGGYTFMLSKDKILINIDNKKEEITMFKEFTGFQEHSR